MIRTGTFIEILMDSGEDAPIPILCGRCAGGWFVSLPDHETAFITESPSDINSENFKMCLSATEAETAATSVRHALKLMKICGGGSNWV